MVLVKSVKPRFLSYFWNKPYSLILCKSGFNYNVHNYHVMTVDLGKANLKTGTDPVPETLFIRWEEFRKSMNSNVIHHHKNHIK